MLHGDAEVLFPVSGVGSYSPAGGCLLSALSLQPGVGSENQQAVWVTSACGSGTKEAWGSGQEGLVDIRSDGEGGGLAFLPAEPG